MDETIHEGAGGLSDEHIAGMLWSFRESETAVLGGVELRLKTTMQEPSRDSLNYGVGGLKPGDLTVTMGGRGRSMFDTSMCEISTPNWMLSFRRMPTMFQTQNSAWDGKAHIKIRDPKVHGDFEQFKLDATMILLFESQWAPEPDPNPLMMATVTTQMVGVSGVGKSYSALRPSGQQIGRGLRKMDDTIIFMDTEKSFDRKMLLKIIKNR